MALAFAPLVIVRQTFHLLEMAADPRLQPLFAYFRQEWIITIPPKMWNVYKLQLRTNNDLEGWHLRFKSIVSRHGPNLWHLLSCIQQEQAATEVVMLQISAGQRVSTQNNKYVKIQGNLDVLLKRYKKSGRNGRRPMTATEYITGVSHNLAQYH